MARIPQAQHFSLIHELKDQVLLSTHPDQVQRIPQGAQTFSSSRRCQYEMWGIGKQVLCLQSSPEFNINVVEELVISKWYDQGRMDDVQKKEASAKVKNFAVPLTRNTLQRFVYQFLHQ